MLAPRPAAPENDQERGQVIIIMVLAMTVVFIIGAITVDIGLWLSERKGAQTDADFIALAGAWELLDPGATDADAIASAHAAEAGNDEQGNAEIARIDIIDHRCVDVDVEHTSRPLFFEIFGLGSPDIGAHAMACAGAIGSPGNLVPFQIDDNPGPCFDDDEAPIYTVMCPLELGAQGGNPRQLVDLDAPGNYCSDAQGGSNTVEELIEWGADGDCFINTIDDCDPDTNGPWYDCAGIQPGNPKAVLDGTAARLARDGACDGSDPGTVDDFDETVQIVFDTGDPFTSLYEPVDCDPNTPGKQISSRLVVIIVFEEPPVLGGGGGSGSNLGYPIEALAAFYVAGCAPEGTTVTSEDDLDRYCDDDYAAIPGQNIYVGAPELGFNPRPNACHNGVPHGQQTCAPTPTPTPTGSPGPTATATPTPSPTPSPTPGPSPTTGPPGHAVVYGRFVKLILTGGGIVPPDENTTLFGIALVE